MCTLCTLICVDKACIEQTACAPFSSSLMNSSLLLLFFSLLSWLRADSEISSFREFWKLRFLLWLQKYHSSPSSSAFCIVLPSLVHATTRKTNEARCSTVIWSLSRTKAGLAIEIPWTNFQSLWENSMGDTTLGISPGYNSDAIHPPVFVTRPERKI